jgi:hypothetical protein
MCASSVGGPLGCDVAGAVAVEGAWSAKTGTDVTSSAMTKAAETIREGCIL